MILKLPYKLQLPQTRLEWRVTIFISATIWFLLGLIDFRIISIPFLLFGLFLMLWTPKRCGRFLWWSAWIGFCIATFQPYEVGIDGWNGVRRGSGPSGFRVIRIAVGQPMHTRLIEKYGEYYRGGCVKRLNDPKWILVWDDGFDPYAEMWAKQPNKIKP